MDDFILPTSVYEDNIADDQECKSFSGTILYSSAGYDQIVSDTKIELDFTDPFGVISNPSKACIMI